MHQSLLFQQVYYSFASAAALSRNLTRAFCEVARIAQKGGAEINITPRHVAVLRQWTMKTSFCSKHSQLDINQAFYDTRKMLYRSLAQITDWSDKQCELTSLSQSCTPPRSARQPTQSQ